MVVFTTVLTIILRDGGMFYPDLFSHSALLLHGALSGQSRQSVSASERDLTHVIWPAERSEENISDRENISVL